MTSSMTASATYTNEDVAKVVQRIKATLVMIADSTRGWTSEKTADYVHDIGELAAAGYLKFIDVSLRSAGVEIKATCFTVNAAAGTMADQRPGDGLWPAVDDPTLKLVLGYNSTYTPAARAAMKSRLIVPWQTSTDDITHSTLIGSAGRTHASNGYGVERKDWK